jgi:hypothetical protein
METRPPARIISFRQKKQPAIRGGVSVGKSIKTVTYQKVSAEANRKIAAVASRISRLEGMEGHARAADVRLRKYYPGKKFDFSVYDHKSVRVRRQFLADHEGATYCGSQAAKTTSGS